MKTTTRSTGTATGHAIGACTNCDAGNATQDVTTGTRTNCTNCGTRIELKMVYGNRSGRACDSSCMAATSQWCQCSCGGENHGGMWLPVEYVPTWEGRKPTPARIKTKQDSKIKAHAAKVAKAAQKAADAAAKLDADKAALLAANPALTVLTGDFDTFVDTYGYGFMMDMRRAFEKGGMTERQVAATVRTVERDARYAKAVAEREAAAKALRDAGVTVPTGRVAFTGTIASTRLADGYMGGFTVKMLIVTDAGWKVWGTMPYSMHPDRYDLGVDFSTALEGMKGQPVTMTATITASDDDPLFGFFKRPMVRAIA